MPALSMPVLRFDGCDITDMVEPEGAVQAYQLQPCSYCGTFRNAWLPFCCELAPEIAGASGTFTLKSRLS
jgi:hypothetical protein